MPAYFKKILLILLVMIASYLALIEIIHQSKKSAETKSAATEEYK